VNADDRHAAHSLRGGNRDRQGAADIAKHDKNLEILQAILRNDRLEVKSGDGVLFAARRDRVISMTDDDNDKAAEAADELDERCDNIARVVKDYLREGDAFLVQCQDDEIIVEESHQPDLEKDHPRLYGRLLSLNDQLETGCALTVALFALAGFFCLGLHAGWLDHALTADVADKLKTWWFYVPLFAALYFGADWFYGWIAKRRYRRSRAELFAVMGDEGFERDTLVPLINDTPEFERICTQLKLDRGPFPHE
jgi:hypothetical protein